MELRKFVACTVCAVTTALAAAGCADGTGQALIPTLPSVDASASNADGTKLKATAPQPLSPRSAIRVSNLTPQLVLQNGAGTFEPSAALSYVFELFEVDGSVQTLVLKSDPIPASSPQTTFNVPANTLKMNKTYAWRAYAVYSGVQGSLSDGVSFRTPLPRCQQEMEPGPVPCGGSSGPSIIGCVAAAYPAETGENIGRRLQPGASLGQHGVHPRPHYRDRQMQGPESRTELQARRAGDQPGLHRAARQQRQERKRPRRRYRQRL